MRKKLYCINPNGMTVGKTRLGRPKHIKFGGSITVRATHIGRYLGPNFSLTKPVVKSLKDKKEKKPKKKDGEKK